MAREGSFVLDNEDVFPHLEMKTTDSGTLSLPDDISGHWSVILFYRGHF